MVGLNAIPGLEVCDGCTNYVEDCDCHEHAEPRVSMVVPSKRGCDLKRTIRGLGPDQTAVTPAVVIRLDQSAEGFDSTVARKAG